MFLKSMFSIGSLDSDFIESYYQVCDDFDFSLLQGMPCGQIDTNTIIGELFHQINYAVFTRLVNDLEEGKILIKKPRLKRQLLQIYEQRIHEFSPYLNCIDSWFQNELDQVTVKNQSIDKIGHEVLPLLLEQLES